MMHIGKTVSSLDSDAARAGAGLGMLLGMGFLAVAWFLPTCGAALLGFLLKKNSIVETGPTGALVGHESPAGLANGWAGLLGSAVIALVIVIVIARIGAQSVPATSSESSSSPTPTAISTSASSNHTWTLNEKTNEMDGTKRSVLMLESQGEVQGFIGSNAAYLVIKCEKGKAETYVSVHTQIQHEYGSEQYGVRLKFDDAAPMRQHWSASTDGTALFSPSPAKFVKELEGANVFLFEFTPFEKTATAVRFNVNGLSEKLAPISDSCGLATQVSER